MTPLRRYFSSKGWILGYEQNPFPRGIQISSMRYFGIRVIICTFNLTGILFFIYEKDSIISARALNMAGVDRAGVPEIRLSWHPRSQRALF